MLTSASKITTQAKLFGNLQKLKEGDPIDVTLIQINKLNHDSYIYRYQLPDPDLPLGLQPGQHIIIHAELPTKEAPQGEIVQRYFTPTSTVNEKGTFDLLVKTYRRGVHPDYPDGGILTQYLESLKIGDKSKSQEVFGGSSIVDKDKLLISKERTPKKVFELKTKKLGMICDGTGIAPMYQFLRAILDNPEDQTEVCLLFANKTEDDILLRRELETYISDPRFKLYYTLDVGSTEGKAFTGHVTPEMIKKTMPAPGDDTLVYLCGPRPMYYMLVEQLKELGYREDLVL